MKYNTYIFDFDYTLADSSKGIIESVNYALEKVGLEPQSEVNIRKSIGMSLKDAAKTLSGLSSEEKINEFAAHFTKKADQVMSANTLLYSDTIEVMSGLKQKGFNVAIVSNKGAYRINDILAKFEISELADKIIGFEDVKEEKPSPEGLLKAVAHFNVEKSAVLYIGDSLIDAKTALSAGVDFGAVLSGTTTIAEFEKLPYVCIAKNLTELMNCVVIL